MNADNKNSKYTGDKTGHLLLFSIIAFSLLGDSMLYVVLPARSEVLSLSPGQVGVLLAVNRVVRLGSNFWAVEIFNRFGEDRPYAVAAVTGAATTFLYGFSQTFWYFFVLRVIWGISYSIMRLKVLAGIFEKNKAAESGDEEMTGTGKLSGIFRAVTRTGILAGMLVGGYLADLFDFSSTSYILGTISLAGIVVLLILYWQLNNQKTTQNKPKPQVSRINLSFFKKLSGDRYFLVLLFSALTVHFTARGVLNSSYSLYLNKLFGESISFYTFVLGIATVSGVVLSTRNLADVFAAPFFGQLSDKFDAGRLLNLILLLNGFILISFAVSTSPLLIVLFPVITFILTSFLVLLLYVNTGDHPGFNPKNKMAALTTAGDLGAALGPLALGLVDLGLNLFYLYLLCAILLIMAAGTRNFIRTDKNK